LFKEDYVRLKMLSIGLTAALAIFYATVFVPSASAATERVLHSFNTTGSNGEVPYSSLIFDTAGNLYGTTQGGGDGNEGTVFELMPRTGGGWTEKVLHRFQGNGTDGVVPYSNVIFDTAGNLYGTTTAGGAFGYGTVYELIPQAGGTWAEKILHSFDPNTGTDGYTPYAGLILDAAGNLYGTTTSGGTNFHYGTVFELKRNAGGGWTEKILHDFNENGADGFVPYAGLVFDTAGNLYGTTLQGGTAQGSNASIGTVFELKHGAGGLWTEKVLHSFLVNGIDGNNVDGGVILDASGNLYGTTFFGGSNNNGTAFELTPGAGGVWTETLLHNFANNGTDGWGPNAGLVFDAGNLYGTTTHGGANGVGTVFELTPSAGTWTESLPCIFSSTGTDGEVPYAGLILDSTGNLYGTTGGGGAFGGGTVFEIEP
jgi:uncharacterized repeat protein (TIGR03803 family)